MSPIKIDAWSGYAILDSAHAQFLRVLVKDVAHGGASVSFNLESAKQLRSALDQFIAEAEPKCQHHWVGHLFDGTGESGSKCEKCGSLKTDYQE